GHAAAISAIESRSPREQSKGSLVREVNRDRIRISVGSDDCAARAGRKARDSDGSPATSNGHGYDGEFFSLTQVVSANRPALRAGDHNRLRSVSSKVASGHAVGAAAV